MRSLGVLCILHILIFPYLACQKNETPTPPKTLNEQCQVGDCSAELTCARLPEDTFPKCLQVCHKATGDGCEKLGPEYTCRGSIDDSSYGICIRLSDKCNPWTQKPCSPQQACQPSYQSSGTYVMRCQKAGSRKQDETCSFSKPCAQNLVCIADSKDKQSFCRKICKRTSDCSKPQQCIGMISKPRLTYCLP